MGCVCSNSPSKAKKPMCVPEKTHSKRTLEFYNVN